MGGFDRAGALRIDQRARTLRPRQQNAAFLEGLADRRDPEAQGVGIEPLAAGKEIAARDDLAIALVDTAAGKHQRAGIEVDFIVADHHEHFDFRPRCAVAQEQDGRCWTRGNDLGHWT